MEASGFPSAGLEAQLLAAHALGETRSWVLAHGSEPMRAIDEADAVLNRRIGNEPIAYILGRREFYGRSFEVSPAVLIPRHETETLVELALELCDEFAAHSVLDLGTGSGILGVTLKLERPGLDVVAADISVDALSVAARNARVLAARVHFMASDSLRALRPASFHLTVSNPPYVQPGAPLPPEVAGFEPPVALYSTPDWQSFYRRLAKEALEILTGPRLLVVEVGDAQAASVIELFEAEGWQSMAVRCDLGQMPRAVAFRLP